MNTQHMKRRPSTTTEAASRQADEPTGSQTRARTNHQTGPVVSGLVRVDVSAIHDSLRLARRLTEISEAPPNCDVELSVRSSQRPPASAMAYLRAEARHLRSIRVAAPDGATVGKWVAAIRGDS